MSYTPITWEPADIVTAQRMNSLEQAVGELNMSYTPNVWSDGDILSAAKMNAMEQALAVGAGDFGTATVTFSLTVPTGYSIDSIGLTDLSIPYPPNQENVYNCYYVEVPVSGTPSFSVLMYRNEAYIYNIAFYNTSEEVKFVFASSPVCSNTIIYNNGTYKITGDGTITGTLEESHDRSER